MTSTMNDTTNETETRDVTPHEDDTEDDRFRSIWGCCRKVQQRYIFIFLSMIGSMTHVMMTLSMSVAIVAMVKSHGSEDNSTLIDACPYDPEDDSSDSGSSSQGGGEFDWDELTQGYVLSAGSFGALISGVLGARIAELWSPKMMYMIANVLGGVINALLPTAARWSVAALITLRAIQGVCNGPLQAIHTILLSTWIPPQERTRLGGLYYSSEAFGTILAMLLSGILISAVSWDFIFYLYAGIVFIWAIFWFMFVYDTPDEHPGISEKEKHYINTNVIKENKVKYPVPWFKILTSGPVWAHVVMMCGNIWTVYILLTRFPTYLSSVLHYNIQQAGIISSLPMITTFIMCVVFATLSQFLKSRGWLSQMAAYRLFNGISTLGPAIMLIIVNQMGCDAVAIIVLLVITCSLNAAFIGGSLYNLIDLGINFSGTLSGIAWMCSNVVTIVSPLIISAIINNNQTVYTWSIVFYMSAGVAVFPYIIFTIFGSVKEQPWNRPTEVKELKEKPSTLEKPPLDTDQEYVERNIS